MTRASYLYGSSVCVITRLLRLNAIAAPMIDVATLTAYTYILIAPVVFS